MLSGISGMMGREMVQMATQQRSSAVAGQGDHDGDQDDGGPVSAGPDVDTSVQTTASGSVTGSLFYGVA